LVILRWLRGCSMLALLSFDVSLSFRTTRPGTIKLSDGEVERTKERLRTRIGAEHEDMGRAGTAQVFSHTHLNPRGRGVPPEHKSDRFFWVLGKPP